MDQGTLFEAAPSAPECSYPHLAATTGYRYGCRCQRCVDGKRAAPTEQRLCRIDGCDQPVAAKPHARRCDHHLTFDAAEFAPKPPRKPKICRIEGCDQESDGGKGYTLCVDHLPGPCEVCGRPQSPQRRSHWAPLCSGCRREYRRFLKQAKEHSLPPELAVAWILEPACQLCSAELTLGNAGWNHGKYAIDHDHQCCPTGHSCGTCIRGLLCPQCNMRLGHFERLLEDVPHDSLAAYLRSRAAH